MGMTVRKSIFETNSSSSHSITIETGGSLWDTIAPDIDGVIWIIGDEFGWGYDEFNDAETKANYAALDFYYCGEEDRLNMLKEVIEDYTGYPVEIDINLDSNYLVYIDHQSIGTACYELYTKEDIKNFIFNKNSILYIDNDNH